ncbi:30S ribosomal protein S27ae [Methanoplanus endosymbiosus]|uniref:Small ribosomal subunit protein eS31 n=1 Tax=Methanoplanus endosymbiosus TaxID=33865 RepID=A0A9E7TKZ3_9EURY|nr:30S ribosomal protein S27ae [Methanoplanus endosymbiosus]UUX93165.1 30S ribosomal protein S27ae [Methanoplanus endosymbiosus]
MVSRYKYYNVEGDKAEVQKKNCPRCGAGVYMAQHKDRVSCGKCGYTEFNN